MSVRAFYASTLEFNEKMHDVRGGHRGEFFALPVSLRTQCDGVLDALSMQLGYTSRGDVKDADLDRFIFSVLQRTANETSLEEFKACLAPLKAPADPTGSSCHILAYNAMIVAKARQLLIQGWWWPWLSGHSARQHRMVVVVTVVNCMWPLDTAWLALNFYAELRDGSYGQRDGGQRDGGGSQWGVGVTPSSTWLASAGDAGQPDVLRRWFGGLLARICPTRSQLPWRPLPEGAAVCATLDLPDTLTRASRCQRTTTLT